MPSPFLQAIHLNNKAVSHLSMMNYQHANDCLVEALTICKGGTNRDNGGSNCCCSFDNCLQGNDHQNVQYSSSLLPSSLLGQHQIRISLANNNSPQRRAGYVFQNPILLSVNEISSFSSDAVSSNIESDLEIVSAAVLLNIAITVHLGAIETLRVVPENGLLNNERANTSITSQLRRAARLYQFAHAILLGLHDNEEDEEQHTLTMLILCGIVNNLGNIHLILEEKDISNGYFQHLLSMLMFLINGRMPEDPHNRHETEDVYAVFLDHFIGSTVHLISGSPTICPAAAA